MTEADGCLSIPDAEEQARALRPKAWWSPVAEFTILGLVVPEASSGGFAVSVADDDLSGRRPKPRWRAGWGPSLKPQLITALDAPAICAVARLAMQSGSGTYALPPHQ